MKGIETELGYRTIIAGARAGLTLAQSAAALDTRLATLSRRLSANPDLQRSEPEAQRMHAR